MPACGSPVLSPCEFRRVSPFVVFSHMYLVLIFEFHLLMTATPLNRSIAAPSCWVGPRLMRMFGAREGCCLPFVVWRSRSWFCFAAGWRSSPSRGLFDPAPVRKDTADMTAAASSRCASCDASRRRTPPRADSLSSHPTRAFPIRASRRPVRPLPHPRIELALCFEDVAKNIFNSKDGTMTRCVCPLPSSPSVPPRGPRNNNDERILFERVGTRPGPSTPSGPPPTPPGPPPFPLRAQGPARRRPLRGHRPRPATVGAQDVPERVRPVRGPRHRGCLPGPSTYLASRPPTPAAAAPRVSAGAPAAVPTAVPGAIPTITTFPPEYLLDPTGCVPVEFAAAASSNPSPSNPSPARWRAASGAGQYPKLPFLGGAGAPFSLLVKGTRAMDHLPPPIDVVRRLHARPSADAFVSHPNDVSGVLAAFAELARKEIGAGSDSGSSRCEMSSYFDLQMLYGTSAEECAAIRTFEGGRSRPSRGAPRRVRFRRRRRAPRRLQP